MTGVGSFWRLSWTATRTPRARALALGEVAVADAVSAVSGHPELRIEAVEGLLGGPLAGRVGVIVVPVAVIQVVGEVGVVVGPGGDLGVGGGQVGHGGVAVSPVVGVELAGLGGQLLVV
jgi:hypothetical protein